MITFKSKANFTCFIANRTYLFIYGYIDAASRTHADGLPPTALRRTVPWQFSNRLYSGRVFFTTTARGNRMPVRATQYNSSTVTCIRTCNTICLAGHCELSMRIYLLLLGLQLISNTRVADNGSPAYRRWQRPAERDRPTRATSLKHDILDQLHAIGHPTTAPLHTPRRHVD